MARGYRREILVSILVIAVSMLAFGVYAWRVQGSIRATAAGIATTQQTIVNQAQLSQVIVDLKRNEGEADRHQARMDAVIPDEEQLLDFRSWMRGQASVHNLAASVEFRDRGKFREGANVFFQNAAVSFDGSFNGFVSFLKELELGADRFLVGFDAFEVTRSAGGYRLGSTAKIFFRTATSSP